MSVGGMGELLFNIKHRNTEWDNFYEIDTTVYEKYAIVSIVKRSKVCYTIMSWPVKSEFVYRLGGFKFINRIEKAKLKMQKIADRKNESIIYLKMVNEIV
jgi:hypothetical protein